MQIQHEIEALNSSTIWYICFAVFAFVFAFFAVFPESSEHTAASYINSLLPETFRVASIDEQ
jgi:hypothetical protein